MIREQGRQVQLVRSVYSKEKVRSLQQVFMTFERRERYETTVISDYLTQEQIEQLTEPERQKLSFWLYKKEDERKRSQTSSALAAIAETLKLAAQGARTDYTFLNETTALSIYSSMDELQKQLRKKGYTRPAQVKAEQVEPEQPKEEPAPPPVATTKAKTAAKPAPKKVAKPVNKGESK